MARTSGTRRNPRVPLMRLSTALTVALVGVLPACGILETTDRGAEEAIVTITGDSPVPLDLITSDAFIVFTDPNTFEESLQIFVADTLVLTALPFDQSYAIASFDRFLIRLTNPDSTVASVRMTVQVDGTVEYDQAATMSQGGSLEFRFQINQFR